MSSLAALSALAFVVAAFALTHAAPLSNLNGEIQPLYMNPKPPVSNASRPLPLHTINLDLPPEQRWKALAEQYREPLQRVVEEIVATIPKDILPTLEAIFGDIDHVLPEPWAGEIRGVAEGANITLGDAVFANFFYEANSACTSIVAMDRNNSILHARNLDYGVKHLQDIAVELHYVKNGRVVFSSVTYVGYIGVLTGVRPNSFSVSIDQRSSENGTGIDNILEAFFAGGKNIGFFLRDLLEEEQDFETAVTKATKTHLVSVAYIILGGVQGEQGAVVTRRRNTDVDVWRIDASAGRWYLVETNYDHDKPVPKGDNRRGPAEAGMDRFSRSNITLQDMYDVLSTYPVLNSETTYTALMSASTGYLSGFVRNV